MGDPEHMDTGLEGGARPIKADPNEDTETRPAVYTIDIRPPKRKAPGDIVATANAVHDRREHSVHASGGDGGEGVVGSAGGDGTERPRRKRKAIVLPRFDEDGFLDQFRGDMAPVEPAEVVFERGAFEIVRGSDASSEDEVTAIKRAMLLLVEEVGELKAGLTARETTVMELQQERDHAKAAMEAMQRRERDLQKQLEESRSALGDASRTEATSRKELAAANKARITAEDDRSQATKRKDTRIRNLSEEVKGLTESLAMAEGVKKHLTAELDKCKEALRKRVGEYLEMYEEKAALRKKLEEMQDTQAVFQGIREAWRGCAEIEVGTKRIAALLPDGPAKDEALAIVNALEGRIRTCAAKYNIEVEPAS